MGWFWLLGLGFWCLCFVLLDFPFDLALICDFAMVVLWCGVMCYSFFLICFSLLIRLFGVVVCAFSNLFLLVTLVRFF